MNKDDADDDDTDPNGDVDYLGEDHFGQADYDDNGAGDSVGSWRWLCAC